MSDTKTIIIENVQSSCRSPYRTQFRFDKRYGSIEFQNGESLSRKRKPLYLLKSNDAQAKLLDSISDLSKQQMKMETANQELQRQVETLRRANEILSKQNQQLIKKEVPVKSHRTPLVETRSASCESFSNNKNLNKDVLLF